MRFRLCQNYRPWMTLNCCTFEFSRNFERLRRRVLYYDSPGGATTLRCRALTFALARLSCSANVNNSAFYDVGKH